MPKPRATSKAAKCRAAAGEAPWRCFSKNRTSIAGQQNRSGGGDGCHNHTRQGGHRSLISCRCVQSDVPTSQIQLNVEFFGIGPHGKQVGDRHLGHCQHSDPDTSKDDRAERQRYGHAQNTPSQVRSSAADSSRSVEMTRAAIATNKATQGIPPHP